LYRTKKKVHNFIGSFFAYKNEIAIAVDAMRTALIAKNGTAQKEAYIEVGKQCSSAGCGIAP